MVLLADAGFRVDNILVEGRVHTDPAVLRALIDLQRGDPLFAFDPAQAQEMIGRLSWVRDVHVERRLPDTVYIGLIEREPIALWQHKGKLRVIDNEGVTITTELTAGMKGLPIVVGEEANKAAAELLALVAADPDLKGRLEAATWVGARRWDMSFAGGVTVRLPEGDLAPALSRLSDAQRRDRVLEEDIESIDLRQPDRMVLRPRAGAVRDYKASYTPI